MLPPLNRVKGIHPGAILKRELKKRKLRSVTLAEAIDEYPQTINAITKERRGINAKLSIKLGDFFKSPHEYFMYLQAAFEVQESLSISEMAASYQPFRKALFWDIDPTKIDWEQHKRFVIQRVLERGTAKEIKALIKRYGLETIKNELEEIGESFIPAFSKNVTKFVLS